MILSQSWAQDSPVGARVESRLSDKTSPLLLLSHRFAG